MRICSKVLPSILFVSIMVGSDASAAKNAPSRSEHKTKEVKTTSVSSADSTTERSKYSKLITRRGGNVVAKADSLPLYWMKEIIVTGQRRRSTVENLANSVSVIGEREIDTATRNSSTDLAGVLPGVFIDRTGDFGRSDVSIRGLGSRGRYALVLVDGRPEKMALFGCAVTHSFPLNDVERIEVVKGASSMLFGSGALGGVMNVIPRIVRDNLEIDFKAYGGSNETWVANGRIAGRKGRVSSHVSLDYRRSEGHVEHSAYDGKDVRAGGEIALNADYSLSLSGKYFDGFKEEPIRYTDDPSIISNTWNDYRRGSVDLLLKGGTGGYTTDIRYYRNFGEHEFSDGWHSRDATDGIMAHGTLDLISCLELSCGTDFRYQQGKLLDQPGEEWNKWEAGVYAAAEYSIGEVIILSAGTRYNEDEIAGGEVSPSAGIVWHPCGSTAVRALVSHGFRTPQINELYMYPSSNENLKAEKVWNYEIGLRRELPGRISIDLSAFKAKGSDMIELVSNGSPPPLFIFYNSGEFEFTGVEASLTGKWDNGIAGRISYSWLDAGEWTTGRPGDKFDIMLSLTRGRLMLQLKGQRIDEYFAGNNRTLPIDPFTVIDVYLESDVVPRLKAFAGVNNILDENYLIYADLAGGAAGLYEMPGITYMAGLKYDY